MSRQRQAAEGRLIRLAAVLLTKARALEELIVHIQQRPLDQWTEADFNTMKAHAERTKRGGVRVMAFNGELARAIGVKSVSTITRYLKKLENEGKGPIELKYKTLKDAAGRVIRRDRTIIVHVGLLELYAQGPTTPIEQAPKALDKVRGYLFGLLEAVAETMVTDEAIATACKVSLCSAKNSVKKLCAEGGPLARRRGPGKSSRVLARANEKLEPASVDAQSAEGAPGAPRRLAEQIENRAEPDRENFWRQVDDDERRAARQKAEEESAIRAAAIELEQERIDRQTEAARRAGIELPPDGCMTMDFIESAVATIVAEASQLAKTSCSTASDSTADDICAAQNAREVGKADEAIRTIDKTIARMFSTPACDNGEAHRRDAQLTDLQALRSRAEAHRRDHLPREKPRESYSQRQVRQEKIARLTALREVVDNEPLVSSVSEGEAHDARWKLVDSQIRQLESSAR